MEILVCIKQVPDDSVSVKMNPATGAPDLASITPIVNAFDTYALEMATRLKEAVGGTVTVVSVGADAKDAIKSCLAVGASNGYVVTDEANDTISTADIVDSVAGIASIIDNAPTDPEELERYIEAQRAAQNAGLLIGAAVAAIELLSEKLEEMKADAEDIDMDIS